MTQRYNAKEYARLLGFSGNALYLLCGQAIADGLWEEFKRLVIETPQYTGSTAASWNIGTLGAGSFGKTQIRTLEKGQTPFHVGHETAVNKALGANKDRLDDLRRGSVKALNSGINVWNDVPWAQRAETGHRRDPSKNETFANFQARVQEKVFDPIAHTVTPEQLKAMVKKK